MGGRPQARGGPTAPVECVVARAMLCAREIWRLRRRGARGPP
jgi:hypothetical protein